VHSSCCAQPRNDDIDTSILIEACWRRMRYLHPRSVCSRGNDDETGSHSRRTDVVWLAKRNAPISPVTRGGGMVFVSGPAAVRSRYRRALHRSIERRTELVLEQLKRCLETAGTSLQNVMKCNVYCTSVEHFTAVNAIYARYFPEDPPARIFVCVPEWFARSISRSIASPCRRACRLDRDRRGRPSRRPLEPVHFGSALLLCIGHGASISVVTARSPIFFPMSLPASVEKR
jgi:2-iminobutanoate/2-iminopropanoate deaminase